MSYLTDLHCYDCKHTYDASKIQTYCPICQAPLIVNYDLLAAKQTLDREMFQSRPAGMWRWRELLPVHEAENMIHLGEGDIRDATLDAAVTKQLEIPVLLPALEANARSLPVRHIDAGDAVHGMNAVEIIEILFAERGLLVILDDCLRNLSRNVRVLYPGLHHS